MLFNRDIYTSAPICRSLVGVAKGVTQCGAESPPVRDPNTWSIKISKDFLYICSICLSLQPANLTLKFVSSASLDYLSGATMRGLKGRKGRIIASHIGQSPISVLISRLQVNCL